jgi:hypothetical protein
VEEAVFFASFLVPHQFHHEVGFGGFEALGLVEFVVGQVLVDPYLFALFAVEYEGVEDF